MWVFVPPYQHSCLFFFFNDTATTEIYTLSLHDALPILHQSSAVTTRWLACGSASVTAPRTESNTFCISWAVKRRSEEHTSELQSPCNLVCRLLLEKKNLKLFPTTKAHRPVDGFEGAS